MEKEWRPPMKDGKYKVKKGFAVKLPSMPDKDWTGMEGQLPPDRIITIKNNNWYNHGESVPYWPIRDDMIECAVECATCLHRRKGVGFDHEPCCNCCNGSDVYDKWQPKQKEAPADYLARHNACGLKVGDRVRVTRKAITGEAGWGSSWTWELDPFVGRCAIITEDVEKLGFNLNHGPHFPYFVLEKVNAEPLTIPTAPIGTVTEITGRIYPNLASNILWGAHPGKIVGNPEPDAPTIDTAYAIALGEPVPLEQIPVGSRVRLVSVSERESDPYKKLVGSEGVLQQNCRSDTSGYLQIGGMAYSLYFGATAIVLEGPKEEVRETKANGAIAENAERIKKKFIHVDNEPIDGATILAFLGARLKTTSSKQQRRAKVLGFLKNIEEVNK